MSRTRRLRLYTVVGWTIVLTALWGRTVCAESESIELSPLVVKLLNDPTVTGAQRRDLALFHGQWDTLKEPTPHEQAQIALYRYDLSNPNLSDSSPSPLLAAEAALLRGDSQLAIDLLADDRSVRASLLRGTALLQQGQLAEAAKQLGSWRKILKQQKVDDAVDLAAATQAMTMLARLEGRPSQDYQLAMQLLAKAHQELDRLYWPAMLAEAELLFERDNSKEAVDALRQTLGLNPHCGRAWYLLGRIGLAGYNFDQANHAVRQLRQVNAQHLLADLLEAHMYLRQKDVAGARGVVQAALSRYPKQRELLAQSAAASALAFDEKGLSDALRAFDELSPASPLAHFIVGRYLSLARQYATAESHLRAAIKRFANWHEPHLELGMLLMQSGDEQKALAELRRAAHLDPFHRRVQNQLKLAEELLSYERIRTDHFLIKFRNGIDEALARDMPDALERIYDDVTRVYGYEPTRATMIEIMPDEQRLAVRITGMPVIWTIAACTGDVIAITPPREGPKQRGPFDWENVIRHEFVHTVTLGLTHYRVPHWFTEACAVSQENKGRDFDTCQMLAEALHAGALFDLEQINWAFVRPKTPRDRPLAYAQSHWMLQYVIETYGHAAILEMLRLYRHGATNQDAVEKVTERPAHVFMSEFVTWARRQVDDWGLGQQPSDSDIEALLTGSTDEAGKLLDQLVGTYPHHPELLRLNALRAIATRSYAAARREVLRYATVRPVDPWSSRALAMLALENGRTDHAVGPLEHLDRMEMRSGQWAGELAKIHRTADRFDQAAAAMTRAIYREPYNAAHRELAAAIALQRGRPEQAVHHIYAMTVLEPDRSIQWVRLAAIYDQLGRHEEAQQAATKARQLDLEAPVERFIKQ